MGYLVHLRTFKTTNVMFTGEEYAILLCDSTDRAFVRLFFFSFSIGTGFLALISHVATEFKLSSIL